MKIDSQCIPDNMKDEENTLKRHCSYNGVEYVAPRPDEDETGTQLRRHMLRMQVKWNAERRERIEHPDFQAVEMKLMEMLGSAYEGPSPCEDVKDTEKRRERLRGRSRRSQDRKDPSRGRSADKATAGKPPLPRYAFESLKAPTAEDIERLRKACWSHIRRYEWPCDVCPRAKSKTFKSEKDRKLWRGKEAFERAYGYRYFLYSIYTDHGVFSDSPDHFPQEFEPGRFKGREGKLLRTEYFKEQKICGDCWNLFNDYYWDDTLDYLSPLYANRWSRWLKLMKDIRYVGNLAEYLGETPMSVMQSSILKYPQIWLL